MKNKRWLSFTLALTIILSHPAFVQAMKKSSEEFEEKSPLPFTSSIRIELNNNDFSSSKPLVSKENEEPFKKALATFKDLRNSHPNLRSLDPTKPKIIIIYPWGIPEEEKIVDTLAHNLKKGGIKVLYDKWHNKGGTNTLWGAKKILNPNTDFVIFCGSENLMKKLDENNEDNSVLRAEFNLGITKRFTWPAKKVNIIPILLEGRHDQVLPSLFGSTVSIGFQDRENYCLNCFSLLERLYGLSHDDPALVKIKECFQNNTNNKEIKRLRREVDFLRERLELFLKREEQFPNDNYEEIKKQYISDYILPIIPVESMSTRISTLEKSLENINIRNQQILQENMSLTRRLSYLEEKIYPSRPLKAKFNSDVGWMPYTDTKWAPVIFNLFEGDERLRGNLSTIEIPEDGTYLLSAEYYWGARNGPTATRTAIAINDPGNILNDWHHNNIAQDTDIKNGLKRRTNLNRGNKVMLSIQGAPNATIFLGHFEFMIEKIF